MEMPAGCRSPVPVRRVGEALATSATHRAPPPWPLSWSDVWRATGFDQGLSACGRHPAETDGPPVSAPMHYTANCHQRQLHSVQSLTRLARRRPCSRQITSAPVPLFSPTHLLGNVWPMSARISGLVVLHRAGKGGSGAPGYGLFLCHMFPNRLPVASVRSYLVYNSFHPHGFAIFCQRCVP